jgi:hypothetical protein
MLSGKLDLAHFVYMYSRSSSVSVPKLSRKAYIRLKNLTPTNKCTEVATDDPLTSAAVVELAGQLAVFSFRGWLEL